MADTRRTHGGQSVEKRAKRNQGGHKADKLWGRDQTTSRPAFLFLRENPTVKFGKKTNLNEGHEATARLWHPCQNLGMQELNAIYYNIICNFTSFRVENHGK